MTGLSIDVIKNQIRLSKMFVGSEAVSTKALKELLEYKETGLTPQDIKEMDKLYLENGRNRMGALLQNRRCFARKRKSMLLCIRS